MTIQSADDFLYQGHRLPLYRYPLECYFDAGNPRPNFECDLTSLQRGYQATWKIEDDTLFLIDLRDGCVNGEPFGLAELFPGCGGKLKAGWLSGQLRVPIPGDG